MVPLARRSLRSSALVIILSCAASAQYNLSTAHFETSFAAGSGVLESLKPVSNTSFDFSPSDVFSLRNGRGQYHTGDLTLRYRWSGSNSDWSEADTAALRLNATNIQAAAPALLRTDLSQQVPDLADEILVSREWFDLDGDLALAFTLQNIGSQSLELGALGMPIEFNNIFTGRTAVETTQKCVLIDPYLGLDAGYVQVTRLTGLGPNLVVTPLNRDSKFEAWRFLDEPQDGPLGYQIQTYEGTYAWQVYSKAYGDNEWHSTTPWNPATSAVLEPGFNLTVGLRFSVAPRVQDIEQTVATAGHPVAVGIPGYVVPHDLNARLFVNASLSIESIDVEPSGALRIIRCGIYNKTWTGFDVQATSSAFGRVRVILTYGDNKTHAVHYWVARPSSAALAQLGIFLTTDQWYTNTSDPFGRGNSVITYDRSTQDYVLQDNRTWIAGLSDEGGAGSFLAAGMKTSVSPVAAEVTKLETFVHDIVWGTLQVAGGNDTYAVRKSLFYYQPDLVPGYLYSPEFNWTSVPGETWNKSAAYRIDRTYDYVHVSALYWSLYRAGRNQPGLLTRQSAAWYLLQAYHTVSFAFANASDGTPITSYTNVGLMGETTWGYLLSDLQAENYISEANDIVQIMRRRQKLWASLADPYGSEMAWDSTGEEGVYYWSTYFNDSATAKKTIDAIRGYMPTVAHWGWNGNARRYWDFLYAGSIQTARIERQIHHYGSGLNALPMLANYRASPDPSSMDAVYDLRVGYGGNQGPLSNIDAGGFGSMAFHSYPDTLHWDPYSGDYGPNFLGHVLGAATYLVNHPTFGWISFGGNVDYGNGPVITVEPKDAVRQRIFIGPLSLYLTVDSGMIQSFTYDTEKQNVNVSIASTGVDSKLQGYGSSSDTPQRAVLTWEQTGGRNATSVQLDTELVRGLGGYLLNLSLSQLTRVSFSVHGC